MIRLCCVDVLSGIGRGLSVCLLFVLEEIIGVVGGWVLLITSYDFDSLHSTE